MINVLRDADAPVAPASRSTLIIADALSSVSASSASASES